LLFPGGENGQVKGFPSWNRRGGCAHKGFPRLARRRGGQGATGFKKQSAESIVQIGTPWKNAGAEFTTSDPRETTERNCATTRRLWRRYFGSVYKAAKSRGRNSGVKPALVHTLSTFIVPKVV